MSYSAFSFESFGLEFPKECDGEFVDSNERHFSSYSFEDATFILSPTGEKVYRAQSKHSNNLQRALLTGVNLATDYGTQVALEAIQLHSIATKHHGEQKIGYDSNLAIGFVKRDNRLEAFTEFITSPDRPKNQPQRLACVMAESAVWLCAVPKTRLEQLHDELVEAPSLPLETQLRIQDEVYGRLS